MIWLLAALLAQTAAEGHRLLGPHESPLLLEPCWLCCWRRQADLGGWHTFFDLRYKGRDHRSGGPCLSVPAVPSVACSSTTAAGKSSGSRSQLSARVREEAIPARTWKRGACASLGMRAVLFRNPGVLQNLGSWFTFRTKFSNKLSR